MQTAQPPRSLGPPINSSFGHVICSCFDCLSSQTNRRTAQSNVLRCYPGMFNVNITQNSITNKTLKLQNMFMRQQLFNLLGSTILPILFRYRRGLLVASACVSHRRLMTIRWPIRQYNVNVQRFEYEILSIRSTWQDRHGAWLIEAYTAANGKFTTDAPQRNATVITPA